MDLGKTLAVMAVSGMAAGLMGCGGAADAGEGAVMPGAEPVAAAPATAKDLHCCRGQNTCAGNGGCHTAENTCAGKNSCKGKGGCSTKPAAECPGAADAHGAHAPAQ